MGNQSSAFYPHENAIRRSGSFIYEEFLPTEGTDVKACPCPSRLTRPIALWLGSPAVASVQGDYHVPHWEL